MTDNGIITIHGKEYMTVAKRVGLAHEDNALQSVETEVLSHDPVVIKAKVCISGRVFTGISAVILEQAKMIEKENPYEVAETSAVGRALGFAGYGLIESIASADEVSRATIKSKIAIGRGTTPKGDSASNTSELQNYTCMTCGANAYERQGKTKEGKEYHGIFCSTKDKTHTVWL